MTEFLRRWILGLAGTALFCAMCSELCLPGRVKKVQKLLCSAAMTLALISPLAGEMKNYSLNLAVGRSSEAELVKKEEEISQSLSRTFIEEKCAAYILDKAQALGLGCKAAEVEVKWSTEGLWYPCAAEINCEYSGELADIIEAELGVGKEAQSWISDS